VSAARHELYVYYRIAQGTWRDAARAVTAWQQRLCGTHPGLSARLLRRPEAQDGAVTLMEVYTLDRDDDALEAPWPADIAGGAPALQPWLLGERHLEHFDALP
jgi:hypothetical protein